MVLFRQIVNFVSKKRPNYYPVVRFSTAQNEPQTEEKHTHFGFERIKVSEKQKKGNIKLNSKSVSNN